ncbi:hypothetical protein C2845_PM17G12140 [Panicum miliaceum]|uniref:Uncharacterized protein n=1 Tax=Panicum miliaceum TaxID=4540 RepID=A0A3L6Q3S4_PANMI|nr:hypothetical protein C2845_PM17G12140 [Panicum miliaceum]
MKSCLQLGKLPAQRAPLLLKYSKDSWMNMSWRSTNKSTGRTLEGFVIVLPAAAGSDAPGGVPAGRVARWLRFAAGRVAGELVLLMPPPRMTPDEPEDVHWAALELPA